MAVDEEVGRKQILTTGDFCCLGRYVGHIQLSLQASTIKNATKRMLQALSGCCYGNTCGGVVLALRRTAPTRAAATSRASAAAEQVTIAGLLTGRAGNRSFGVGSLGGSGSGSSSSGGAAAAAADSVRRRRLDAAWRSRWWATPGFAVASVAMADALIYTAWRVAFKRPRAMDFMERNFTSSYVNLRSGRLWTLASAAVSHAEFGQLLANLNAVYSCGLPLAQLVGPRKFFAIYGGGAVASALGLVAVDVLRARRRGKQPESQPVLGGSGAATALLTAFAVAYPHSIVLVNGYVRLPVIVEALATAIYDLANIGRESQTGVSHAGHFAGAVFGVLASLLFLRTTH